MRFQPLTEHQLLVLWVQLLVLVLVARGLGAVVRRWGQPAVVGELAAAVGAAMPAAASPLPVIMVRRATSGRRADTGPILVPASVRQLSHRSFIGHGVERLLERCECPLVVVATPPGWERRA